ncbi:MULTISPECIES: acid-soluble spore protein SspM [Bacillus amyloliquefaciens group]|nr:MULTISPECIES: acid-soluble spore protein SspM [Bacillus amyloliquefaciens group]ASF29200.1 spore protein [Bacillus amyloliquefaciens]MDQ8091652.1 acid-soluble spore protein SspM [Bacillus amyloliquefaciens]
MKTRPKKAGKQQKNEAKTTDMLDKKLGGPNRPST